MPVTLIHKGFSVLKSGLAVTQYGRESYQPLSTRSSIRVLRFKKKKKKMYKLLCPELQA